MTSPTPVVVPGPSIFDILRTEPALVTSFLAAAATLLASFVFHASQTKVAAIVVIATALVTILTAALATPVRASVLAGAVVTGLTAAVAFGLRVPADDLAVISTVIVSGLTLFLRGHLTPNVNLRKP